VFQVVLFCKISEMLTYCDSCDYSFCMKVQEITQKRITMFKPKLFEILKQNYTKSMFVKDLVSGITVGIVALPLAIAFAIGANASPMQGLWTAIIAGFSIALLGGSRYQVSGPTGAFVVIIAGVIAQYGMDGLITATFLAGVLLVILGALKLGSLIKFIPYPVTVGFTTGIGFVIAGGQIKDFLGLTIPDYKAEFFERMEQIVHYIGTINYYAAGIGIVTIVIILLIRKLFPRLPAAIIAVILTTLTVYVLKLPVETISTRFGALSSALLTLKVPAISWNLIRTLLPAAVTIAFLGSIESLLSAVVADGMTGDKHDSNTELMAQGVGNMLCGLAGCIPATGAIARTATNIKNGAVSPISAIIHALVLLIFTLFASNLASAIPLATLSGILLVVAWDMAELRRFLNMKTAPKSDALVMLTTFALTVAVDLTVAVEIGLILAVFLFVKRMSETVKISTFETILDKTTEEPKQESHELAKGIEVYEINGPFFFGNADILQDTLEQLEKPPRVFILRMRHVPAIDATAVNALVSFIKHCKHHKTQLILSEVNEQPQKVLESMGIAEMIGKEHVCSDFTTAVEQAKQCLK